MSRLAGLQDYDAMKTPRGANVRNFELTLVVCSLLGAGTVLGGGPPRTATVLATQSLVQKGLIDTLGLKQFA